ncbi:MAG TPA: fibronectin type III domain-containing protein [Myxococcota bacterium]|nr:fibronectin type III domain-containing protein [Myxococcota bacterium]
MFALLLALAPSGLGASPRELVIEWIPPAGASLGYRAYVGNEPSLYRQIVDLGVVPIDLDGIGRATLTLDSTLEYYIAVSAYNDAGESELSNEKRVAASACDPSACDDAQQCTADDCGPNGCTHAAVPDGTFCSAGSNSYGMCFSGACMPAQCTEASHCDDGNVCNGAESCSPLGVCGAGTPIACGRPSQCSVPVCDPAYGGCRAVPRADGTPCDDRRRSTINDVCRAGTCRGTRVRK